MTLVRRVIRCRRGGELLNSMNDVRIAQLNNRTSQRGMIRQVRNMTVNCSTEVKVHEIDVIQGRKLGIYSFRVWTPQY